MIVQSMKLALHQKILWTLVCVAVFLFVGLSIWSEYRNNFTQSPTEPPFFAKFELTNHRGIINTQEDFAGRWMLIFFGFTNCPDICPTTLAEVAAVMNMLGTDTKKVQPIFITIDPERDTRAALAEYVPLFDADIIGLTGSPNQITTTSKIFPIYFERIKEATAPDGYTMGHTSHLFLFDPNAGFVDSWPYGTSAEEILAALKKRI